MRWSFMLAAGLLAAASTAWAEGDAVRPLRLLGAAPGAKDPVPTAFVIDARIKPGDGEAQSEVEGWFASIVDPATYGAVSGTCVERHCALTATITNGKLAIVGDLIDAAPNTPARFTLKDDDDKPAQSGPVTVGPLAGAPPGLGELAAYDAIDEAGLDDLLMWSRQSISSGSPPSEAFPDDTQHSTLADWQQANDRKATGLIFTADLAALRAARAAAQKAAGWTAVADPAHGWSAAYPAALLPVSGQAGAGRRFASADGKATLTLAIDPPMSGDAFDDFVHRTESHDGGNLTRVNDDMTVRWETKDQVTIAAYHNRPNGFARLEFVYPKARADDFDPYEIPLQRAFNPGDDVKP